MIALACDQVIMHPDAELGGKGAYRPSQEDIDLARRSIRAEDSPWAERSWSLVAAMIDPELSVFHCTRPGEEGYFCEEELEERRQKDRDGRKWQQGKQLPRPLLLRGDQAVAFGLADRTVDSLGELLDYYGLEKLPGAGLPFRGLPQPPGQPGADQLPPFAAGSTARAHAGGGRCAGDLH